MTRLFLERAVARRAGPRPAPRTQREREDFARYYGARMRRIHREALREQEKLIRETLELLREAQQRAIQQLALVPPGRFELRLRSEIIAELQARMREVIAMAPDRVQRGLEKAFTLAEKRGQELFDLIPPELRGEMPRVVIGKETATALSQFTADLIQQVSDEMIAILSREITTSMLAGDSLAQTINRLVGDGRRIKPIGPFKRAFDRAETIVRTEWGRLSSNLNWARTERLADADPTLRKMWIATIDDRTRPEHLRAHGQVVPAGEPFVVGGEKLMFPHDTSLGASAWNTINCRCTYVEVPLEIEHEVGELFAADVEA